MTSEKTAKGIRKAWKSRAAAETITALSGTNSIQRNLSREDRAVWATQQANHKAIYGDDMPEDDETITNNIDSPVTHNHYQPPQKQGGGWKSVLLGAGLTAVGGPIAAAAGMYVYDKLTAEDEQAPIVQPVDGTDTDTDTRVQLRLRKGGE